MSVVVDTQFGSTNTENPKATSISTIYASSAATQPQFKAQRPAFGGRVWGAAKAIYNAPGNLWRGTYGAVTSASTALKNRTVAVVQGAYNRVPGWLGRGFESTATAALLVGLSNHLPRPVTLAAGIAGGLLAINAKYVTPNKVAAQKLTDFALAFMAKGAMEYVANPKAHYDIAASVVSSLAFYVAATRINWIAQQTHGFLNKNN